MDIKRFKAWAESKKLSTDGETGRNYSYTFYDSKTQAAWGAWQAAKAQAVPEGYVLASKEPSADLVDHGHQVFLGHFNEGRQTGGRSLYFAYKAMIEAQENKG